MPLPQQFNCYMFGPVLATFGRQDQKARFLPRAANLDDWWCQGFSEPGAGSDLAAVRTRIEPRDGHFLVDGQKVWSSFAHMADFCILVGLTDREAPRYRGLTYVIVIGLLHH